MIILFYRLQALELGLQDFNGFVIDVLQIIRFVFNFWSPSPKTVSRKQVSSMSCEYLGISWDTALVTLVVFQISNHLILVPAVYRIPKNNNMALKILASLILLVGLSRADVVSLAVEICFGR